MDTACFHARAWQDGTGRLSTIVHRLWTMGYGLWTMDYGLWTMDFLYKRLKPEAFLVELSLSADNQGQHSSPFATENGIDFR